MFSSLFNKLDPRKIQQHYNDALIMAAKNPSFESITTLSLALKSALIEVDARDASSYTALMWAVNNGQLEKIILLLRHQANPHLTTNYGQTILHLAASEGHRELYQYLSHRFPELHDKRDEEGMTPDELGDRCDILRKKMHANRLLISAAKNTSAKCTSLLLLALENLYAEVDARDTDEFYTPLMWSARLGQLENIKILLKHHADPHLITACGNTALHIAARFGRREVYHYLARCFPELRGKKGENGMTPVQLAEKYDHPLIVKDTTRYFSNQFFTGVKASLPTEMAVQIASQIHDPNTLMNLSLVNKTWHSVTNDPSLKNEFEQYLRSFLIARLQEATWKEIIDYYFPTDTTKKSKNKNGVPYPEFTMKAFIKKMTTYYVRGREIQLIKTFTQEPIVYYTRMPPIRSQPISCIGMRQIHRSEIATNCNFLFTKSSKSTITAFKSLDDAFQDDLKSNAKCVVYPGHYDLVSKFDRHYASPLYEVTIPFELGLSLLNKGVNHAIKLAPENILSVKNYRLVTNESDTQYYLDHPMELNMSLPSLSGLAI